MNDIALRDSALLERYKHIIKYGSFDEIILNVAPVLKPDILLSHLAIDLVARAEVEIAFLQNTSLCVDMSDSYETPEFEDRDDSYTHDEFISLLDWILETLSCCNGYSYAFDTELRSQAEESGADYLYSTNVALEFMLRCLKGRFINRNIVISNIFILANTLYEVSGRGYYDFSLATVVKQISSILESEV